MVSAGNTGALMALASSAPKTLPGIDRPAIAALTPTRRQRDRVRPRRQRRMRCRQSGPVRRHGGGVRPRGARGHRSTVGLLNIGTEEVKGHDTIREAAAALRASHLPIEFRGFVEGSDLTSGKVDVVVTDGFTGNVALKVLKEPSVCTRSFCARLSRARCWLRPVTCWPSRRSSCFGNGSTSRYNGAMFLGLNGIVVKSHGGTDALVSPTPSGWQWICCSKELNERITAELNRLEEEAIRRRHAGVLKRCARGSSVRGLTCRPGSSAMTSWRRRSTPATPGSSSARASSAAAHRRRGELTSDLAVAAHRAALERAEMGLKQIDLPVVATSTSDNTFPACATALQRKLGALRAAAFDVQGGVQRLHLRARRRQQLPDLESARTAVVIGAETFSGCSTGAIAAPASCLATAPAPSCCAPSAVQARHSIAACWPRTGGRPPLRGSLRGRRPVVHRHHRPSADERPRGVPSCDHRADRRHPSRPREGRAGRGGCRLAGAAPGEHPHSRWRRAAPGNRPRARSGDGRSPRQHLGGIDTTRPGRSRCRRQGYAGSTDRHEPLWAAVLPGVLRSSAGETDGNHQKAGARSSTVDGSVCNL